MLNYLVAIPYLLFIWGLGIIFGTASGFMHAPCEPTSSKKTVNSTPANQTPLAQAWQGKTLPYFAAVLCLGILLLPFGSLPALISWPFSAVLLGFINILGFFFFVPPSNQENIRKNSSKVIIYLTYLAYFGSFISLSIFAYKKGIPGNLFALDNFVAVPVWLAGNLWAKFGFILIFMGNMGTLAPFKKLSAFFEENFALGLCAFVWLWLAHASLVTLLLPQLISTIWNLPLLTGLVADALFYLLKTFILMSIFTKFSAPKLNLCCLLFGQGLIILATFSIL